MSDLIAKRVIYEGYVQGVGFRYTAMTLARRFAVTGYVINMPDGTVEVVVEGLVTEVEDFLKNLTDEMSQFIEKSTVQSLSPTGQYRRFEVRHA